MSFCENIGEQVELKGINSNRKVYICNAGVGALGNNSQNQQIVYCPYLTIINARACKEFSEPQTTDTMIKVGVDWYES